MIDKKLKLYWVDLEIYRKIINENNFQINFFQKYNWLKIISSNNNLELKFLIIEQETKILSITPFTKKNILNFRLYGCPLIGTFSFYSGIIFNKTLSTDEILYLVNVQTIHINKLSNYTEYTFDYASNTKTKLNKFFKKLGYQFKPNKTLIIKLNQSEDLIWKNLESRSRNSIRKAKKNDLYTKIELPDENWINIFYDMLKETFKRSKRTPIHSKNFYLSLIKLPKENIMFASTYKNKKVLSKAIFLIDENKIIYFSGSTNQQGYNFAANNFLLWEVISLNINKKIKYFDFGGLGNSNIDKFKKSFGGEEVIYDRWVKTGFFIDNTIKFAKFLSNRGLIKIKTI